MSSVPAFCCVRLLAPLSPLAEDLSWRGTATFAVVFGLSWIAITPLIGDIQGEFAITSAEIGLLTTMVSVAKVVAPLLTGLLAAVMDVPDWAPALASRS